MPEATLGLKFIDYVVIGIYFLCAISVGLLFAKRASKGTDEFFLAGRKLRWWMAGGSMVAAMFASDTPLFHTGIVRNAGLSGGWLFIMPMFGALLAAAVFAPLVRRSRVVTDAEFIELRYSGSQPAPFRAFMALYMGLFTATLIMAWVTKGMQQVVGTVMGVPADKQAYVVIGLLVLVAIYSMAAGMWGVVMADLFQYVVASFGSIFLAYMAVKKCGGFAGLRDALALVPNYSGSDMHFIPNFHEFSKASGEIMMTVPLVITWILVNGAAQASSAQHQGQRVLACKTEKDASLTYVFFSFCYYIVNGMPWFITGLASIVVLGATDAAAGITAPDQTFPAMIKVLMPAGLMGLMVASIFAAFMSCVSVMLNWGGSYIVNDLYRRFLVREATEKHYVWISRLASALIAIMGALLCLQFSSLTQIMIAVPPLLTGMIFIYVFRMLWWRINIFSEISAYVSSLVIGSYVNFVMSISKVPDWLPAWWGKLPGFGRLAWEEGLFGWEQLGPRMAIAAGGTTLVFIIVSLITNPTDMEKLKAFYVRVRPPGPGWNHVRRQFVNPPRVDSVGLLLWVYCTLLMFMMGSIMTVINFIRANNVAAGFCLALAVVGAILVNNSLNRMSHDHVSMEPEEAIGVRPTQVAAGADKAK